MNKAQLLVLKRILRAEMEQETNAYGWYEDYKTNGNTLNSLERRGYIEMENESVRSVRLTEIGRSVAEEAVQ